MEELLNDLTEFFFLSEHVFKEKQSPAEGERYTLDREGELKALAELAEED